MTIKYRYALNTTGTIVDVHELAPDQRRVGAPFTCLGCGTELVPHLGTSRHKHFAHKDQQVCPLETYLHRLAKQVFVEAYTAALANHTPFLLQRRIDIICTHYEESFGYTCDERIVDTHDLTHYFDQIAIEAPIGNFRADVLLTSSHHEGCTLVEFAVTHICEPEKSASGYRIIEMRIESEETIEAMRSTTAISAGTPHVKLHNFAVKQTRQSACQGDCKKRIIVFKLFPSRKSVLTEAHPQNVLEGNEERGTEHFEILDIASSQGNYTALYVYKVREAHFAGLIIRNCFVCRYHGGNDKGQAIFCRLHRDGCSSNQAAECNDYWPFESMDACLEADARNRDYLRAKGSLWSDRKMLGNW